MKAYVVNLKSASERKEYVKNAIKPFPSISIEWIDAVDGRTLSCDERKKVFDTLKFQKHYLKMPRPGEIGCTLSHQKCYRKLLESELNSVIILEDDVVFNSDVEPLLPTIEQFLNTNTPRVLLLSGWFWYNRKDAFNGRISVCKVFDGYLTHAYALNRAAANLMVDSKPFFLADAWEHFSKIGVEIYGLSPHPVDQDWSGVFKSDVLSEKSVKTSFNATSWFRLKLRGLKQRVYTYLGRFEAPEDMSVRMDDIKCHHQE